jgi:hypothetical protein
MVGRDGGQKFRGQPEGKALKQQGCLKSFRELFAGLGSYLLFPCAGLSSCQGKLFNNIDLYLYWIGRYPMAQGI